MLGEQDTLLTERAANRCAGVALPLVSDYNFNNASLKVVAESGTGSYPVSCRLNDTTGVVLYIKPDNTELRYKIVTVSSEYDTEMGGQEIFLNISPSIFSGYTVVNIQDDKLLFFYTISGVTYARIANYSGGVLVIGSPVSINTAFVPVLETNQLYADSVAAGVVAICSRNTDGFKPSVQIISIDALDNITFGSVEKSVTDSGVSIANVRIAVLSNSRGVLLWNSSINQRIESFMISGVAATLYGSALQIPTVDQFPGYANFGIGYSGIAATSVNTAIIVGSGSSTLNPNPTLHAPMYMNATETTGVMSVGDATHSAEFEQGDTTPMYPSVVVANNDIFVLQHEQGYNPDRMLIVKISGEPITFNYTVEIDSVADPIRFRTPTITHLGGFVYLGAYEFVAGASGIKTFALRAT